MCNPTILLPCKLNCRNSSTTDVTNSITDSKVLSKFIIRFIYYHNFIEIKVELQHKLLEWFKTHLNTNNFTFKIFPKGKRNMRGGRTDCAVADLIWMI